MPFNLLKNYPQLLELNQFNEYQRRDSLMGIFQRDVIDNPRFVFRKKQIRPTKKDGESPMMTLYNHLTTEGNKDDKGKKSAGRSFEMDRSLRLHWLIKHTEEITKEDGVEVFSYEDRIDGKDVIRTYIYNKVKAYVVILEPQRSKIDYYLLTAYYLNQKGGKKQIEKKLKKKLEEVY